MSLLGGNGAYAELLNENTTISSQDINDLDVLNSLT
jgi:hypothetical protein